jgi:hypothetical protein
MIRFITYFLGF